jgi:cytochrome c oxidase assembly protein subunit 20
MATPVPPNPNSPTTNSNQKTLNVWNKPIDEKDAKNQAGPVTFSEAYETVKLSELPEVAKYPCVRNALLTGIASGFGAGGLRFIVGGKVFRHPMPDFRLMLAGHVFRCVNWACGTFLAGSMASYEWCQYGRRCERREMKRNIEIVTEGRKEQARKKMEQQKEEAEARRLQELQKPWYKKLW